MPSRLKQLLADIVEVFPRQELRPRTLEVYERELEDLPEDVLEDAVRETLRTSEYFPTIRAIREAAAERRLAIPNEAQALTQVERRIEWGRSQQGDPPAVHPLVEVVLSRVGGYAALRQAEEPTVVRGQFGRLFREERARAIRVEQVGDVAAARSSR